MGSTFACAYKILHSLLTKFHHAYADSHLAPKALFLGDYKLHKLHKLKSLPLFSDSDLPGSSDVPPPLSLSLSLSLSRSRSLCVFVFSRLEFVVMKARLNPARSYYVNVIVINPYIENTFQLYTIWFFVGKMSSSHKTVRRLVRLGREGGRWDSDFYRSTLRRDLGGLVLLTDCW